MHQFYQYQGSYQQKSLQKELLKIYWKWKKSEKEKVKMKSEHKETRDIKKVGYRVDFLQKPDSQKIRI